MCSNVMQTKQVLYVLGDTYCSSTIQLLYIDTDELKIYYEILTLLSEHFLYTSGYYIILKLILRSSLFTISIQFFLVTRKYIDVIISIGHPSFYTYFSAVNDKMGMQ